MTPVLGGVQIHAHSRTVVVLVRQSDSSWKGARVLRLIDTCALFGLLLTCVRPQTDPTEPKALPGGVLAGLVHAQEVDWEDQFGIKHKKGGGERSVSRFR